MSNHRNLSLDRSKHAWDAANKAKSKDETGEIKFKEFVVLVKNLPANISNSGLGQTLAFLKSKGKAKENLLLGCIGKWLIDERKIYPTNAGNGNQDIIQRVQNGDIDQYRWATSEVMELITWLKLHSSSLNVKDKTNRQPDEPEDDHGEGSLPDPLEAAKSETVSDADNSNIIPEPVKEN